MRDAMRLATIVVLICGSVGLAAAASVFAPAEVDASRLPVNPLQAPTHLMDTTGLLIAQANYELPQADYAAHIGTNLAPYAMGAYRAPAGDLAALSLTTPPAVRALTPDVASLNSELGHMLMSTPAEMGLTTRSMFEMPLTWKQLDTLSTKDFQLQNYQDGMREVYGHLQ